MASTTIRERTLRRRRERALKHVGPAGARKRSSAVSLVLALLLVIGTFSVYGAVRTHDFINYDDDTYVYKNAHITSGLSWETVRWSLTATEQANWHPVTWLSHALDCQLFQLDAGYHHLISVLFHAVNVLLLFLVLQYATGATGRSFAVAGLFAWHPFNVQSVAWVAERKNVLSTLFVLLAIGAYGWYSQKPQRQRFLAVAILFALALASKPMAITLPLLLLLLDYWSLQRMDGWSVPSPRFEAPQQSIAHLLLEKIPLFILSATSCAVTFWAQKVGGSVRSLHAFPLQVRIGNALSSYVSYIWKMLWPSQFALFYPHPGTSLGLLRPILALILLIAVSTGAWKHRASRPYFLVGWLWFLVSLVPVIGLVQVGDQAMADRYAYLPLIGLFLVVVWGGDELLSRLGMRTAVRWAIAVAALATVSRLTVREIAYWQDSVSVWSRTLQITTDNLLAEQNIAAAFTERGDGDQAVPHFLNVLRLDPNDLASHMDLGVYYGSHGRTEDAIREFETVAKLTDQRVLSSSDRRYRASAQLNLGLACIFANDYARALISFRAASQTDPTMLDRGIQTLEGNLSASPAEDGYVQLSLLMTARGKNEEALSILENASRENPGYVKIRELLNYLNSISW